MLVKIHPSYRTVIAICDSDLIGQKLQENDKELDLTGNFFKGEEKTPIEVQEIIEDQIREDATFNIVGKESCKIALENGLIEESGIARIKGIPFSLVVL